MTADAQLVTVSGTIPADLARADRRRDGDPRADYLELAAAFDADLLDHADARRRAGRIGRLLGRLAGDDAVLAWACFRRRKQYDVVFTDGEQVGLPVRRADLARPPATAPRDDRAPPVAAEEGPRAPRPPAAAAHRRASSCTRPRSSGSPSTGSATRPTTSCCTPFMVDTEFWRPDQVDGTDRRDGR